jgi:hypothetical protein
LKAFLIILVVIGLSTFRGTRTPLPAPFLLKLSQVAYQHLPIATQFPDLPDQHFSNPLNAVVTDTEALVVYQVVERYCSASSALGSPTISIQPPDYSFDCAVAAGQAIGGAIERFPNQEAAHAAFDAQRGELPLEAFHTYPAYAWQVTHTPPFTERGHSYEAGRWIVRATATSETHFGPSPPAEAIYQAAARYCLFPKQRCSLYLALIWNGSVER